MQPADLAVPLGSVNRPVIRKRNGGRRSRPGLMLALSLPFPRGRVTSGGGGGGGGPGDTTVAVYVNVNDSAEVALPPSLITDTFCAPLPAGATAVICP